jgi:hypothetical protein
LKLYFKKDVKYSETTHKLDTDFSIDAFIDGIPVQYRFQSDKNKTSRSPYHPTIRYKRENSNNPKQHKSEWFKIKKNKENGSDYPKLLIWGLIDDFDNPKKFSQFKIINIDKLYDDYDKKILRIMPDDEDDIDDIIPNEDVNEPDFKGLDVIGNRDGSSSFLLLNEVEVEFSISN